MKIENWSQQSRNKITIACTHNYDTKRSCERKTDRGETKNNVKKWINKKIGWKNWTYEIFFIFLIPLFSLIMILFWGYSFTLSSLLLCLSFFFFFFLSLSSTLYFYFSFYFNMMRYDMTSSKRRNEWKTRKWKKLIKALCHIRLKHIFSPCHHHGYQIGQTR